MFDRAGFGGAGVDPEERQAPFPERAASVRPTDLLRLYRHLPYLVELDDQCLRTRENALMMALEIRGLDGFTGAAAAIAALRGQLSDLLCGLDDRFSFYLHRLTRPADPELPPVKGATFAAALDARWRDHLAARDLKEAVLVLTVIRAPRGNLKLPLFEKKARRVLTDDTRRRRDELMDLVSIIETGLPITARRLSIHDGSLLGFLAALNTGAWTPRFRGDRALLAEVVAGGTALRFERRHFELVEGSDAPRYGAVLRIDGYPPACEPGMLDALDAQPDTILCHSYTPIARESIAGRVRRRVAQMEAAGDLAETVRRQLFEAADGAESGTLGFGQHQMTLTVFADSRAALDARAAKLRGLCQQAGFTVAREATALETTFFASHPGNMDYRMRDRTVSSLNFADMAALHTTDIGTEAAQLPWRAPVTAFPTLQGTLHRFSFHEPGNPQAEPSLGHTLVLGRSSGGKTTTLAFLIAQAQRMGARTLIFDKDEGWRMAVTALGGRYAGIRAGQPTGLNPLATEDGARGAAWLIDWISALLESRGAALSPQQSDMLKRAIRQNGAVDPSLRNFRDFQALFGDANDGRDLALRIGEWGPSGRYAWVFGEAEEPVVDLAANPVTALDLTELLDLDTERTAVLGYLFRRIETLMEDRRPTLIVIDEAWKVLDDAYFARKLSDWLVTARKKNAVVVMLTQFPSQVRKSRARTILEGLPAQLLFPNREAQPEDYADFRLTEGELGFVLSGSTGKRAALMRSARGATVLDVDLVAPGQFLTVLGGGKAGEAAFGAYYADYWREFS